MDDDGISCGGWHGLFPQRNEEMAAMMTVMDGMDSMDRIDDNRWLCLFQQKICSDEEIAVTMDDDGIG